MSQTKQRAILIGAARPGLPSLRSPAASAPVRFAIWHHASLFRLLVSFAAIGGMTASVLHDLHVRTAAFAGSDMKTLFASAWCFAHGQNAYSLANVQSVFVANGVVFPQSWFAHAPVYPPTTLALLAPLSMVPMVPAIYSVILGSSILFAFAVAALMRQAARGRYAIATQLAIAVAAASCPLFSFAASMANVSVAACSLCILAFLYRTRGRGWLYGLALAIAVLLKPHLAIWMLTGMLLLPDRAARAVAARAALLAAAFSAVVGLALLRSGHLGLQFRGFVAILRSEMANGSSMSPGSHEVVPLVAQITSLHSLLGFWWNNSTAQSVFVFSLVVALGMLVAWQLRRTRVDNDVSPAMGAWLAFGLLATYHRAHDAMVLLLLLPWLFDALQRSPRRWRVWAVLSLIVALNLSVPFDLMRIHVPNGALSSLLTFLSQRQAAFADLGILLVLLGNGMTSRGIHSIWRSAKEMPTPHVFSAS